MNARAGDALLAGVVEAADESPEAEPPGEVLPPELALLLAARPFTVAHGEVVVVVELVEGDVVVVVDAEVVACEAAVVDVVDVVGVVDVVEEEAEVVVVVDDVVVVEGEVVVVDDVVGQGEVVVVDDVVVEGSFVVVADGPVVVVEESVVVLVVSLPVVARAAANGMRIAVIPVIVPIPRMVPTRPHRLRTVAPFRIAVVLRRFPLVPLRLRGGSTTSPTHQTVNSSRTARSMGSCVPRPTVQRTRDNRGLGLGRLLVRSQGPGDRHRRSPGRDRGSWSFA